MSARPADGPAGAVATRFAGVSRKVAAAILLAALAAACVCLAVILTRPGAAPTPASANADDLQLYRRVAERVHAGDSYYTAAGGELRARGYHTGSVFDFRPPAAAYIVAAWPSPEWAKAILVLAGALAVALTWRAARKAGTARMSVAAALLMGAALAWNASGDAFFAAELWAATAIALSVALHGLGRHRGAAALGVSALVLRELSLPYAVGGALFAWRERRHGELSVWLSGLVLVAALFAVHAAAVVQASPATDVTGSRWIAWGGLAFVLRTLEMNGLVLAIPALGAAYLPIALVGFAAWPHPLSARLAVTLALYLAAFSVLGRPRNLYWGLLYAPLLPLGAVWGPAALRDLLAAVRRRS